MKKKIMLVVILIIILAAAVLFFLFFNKKSKKEIQINPVISESDNYYEENITGDIEDKKEIQREIPAKEEYAPKAEENFSAIEKSEENHSNSALEINNKLVSWGFTESSSRKIDTIIIHSSYNSLGGDERSLSKILDIYKDYDVSSHYIISRDGKIYRLVEDKNIAYHAGESEMPDGRKNVNNFSIGIEIINIKTESPNAAQYNSLKKLLAELKNKHKIKYTLGHSDIAPGRKDDPWNFDWDKIE